MTAEKTYSIKEIFYSPQGEGHRTGTMNVFVRFAGCNLQCTVEREGFNCDTNFREGRKMTLAKILEEVSGVCVGRCKSVILTGGEPTLQIDAPLMEALKDQRYFVALETNGTRTVSSLIDYIACSPKIGHAPPVLKRVNEVRCVVSADVEPEPYDIIADHYFVSPAAYAPEAEEVHSGRWTANSASLFTQRANIAWVVKWCRQNPRWRISLQTHKMLGVR